MSQAIKAAIKKVQDINSVMFESGLLNVAKFSIIRRQLDRIEKDLLEANKLHDIKK